MAYLNDTTCCGLHEIVDLEDSPKKILLDVCDSKYDRWGDGHQHAFLMFSDVLKYKNGTKLAAFIEKNKLGTIYKTTRAKKNPNTGNYICVWIWSPNEKKLKVWWNKNKQDDDEDDY